MVYLPAVPVLFAILLFAEVVCFPADAVHLSVFVYLPVVVAVYLNDQRLVDEYLAICMQLRNIQWPNLPPRLQPFLVLLISGLPVENVLELLNHFFQLVVHRVFVVLPPFGLQFGDDEQRRLLLLKAPEIKFFYELGLFKWRFEG